MARIFLFGRRALLLGLLISTTLAAGMVIFTQSVSAQQTPVLCDSNGKYWCGKVSYTSIATGWTINTRWWEGGWGFGGALSYQLWLSRDWEWKNNAWQNTWGCPKPCSGEFNGSGGLDQWRTIGPVRNVVTNTTVQFQERYFDCGGGCHYWCEPLQEHYLWNNTNFARNLSCN